MRTTIVMPALSPGMTEGKLIKWLKCEGDSVSKGEAIAEIETDKSVLELEALETGRLAKIIVAEDTDAVEVDTPLAILERNDEVQSDLAATTERPEVDQPHREERFTTEVNSSVRKIIAERVTEAKSSIPHFYLTLDCSVDELLKVRKAVNASTSDDTKASINDFIISASARALRDVPRVNAIWDDEAILIYDDVDVAVAVATPDGIVTPVIRNADSKSVAAIALETKNLAERARNRRLDPAETRGGCFCVSNLGMHGIRQFSAIISPPHSAILAIGAAEARPVVRHGELSVNTVMTCTLSCDHRLLDGEVGARFLNSFKQAIENPACLIARSDGKSHG